MATYQELRTRSQQVRDEQNIGGNTALRVGQLLMDIVKYFNDNDAAASEYLQQHFAMVNDGTRLLNWQQSPIVILHTMGEAYDDGDWSALSQGENFFRNGFITEADGQGGGINGETPKANVLYVNLANDTLYTWNGASFDAITSGGGGGSISGDDILKNAYYLNGNLVLVFETESGDKTVTIPVNFDAQNYVPTSRTVNGKALSNNIVIGMSDIPGLLQAIANAGSGAVSVTTNQDGTFVIHVGSTDYTINLNHTHENMAKLIVCEESDLPSTLDEDTIYGVNEDGEIAMLYVGGLPFYGGGGGDTSTPVLRQPADGSTIDVGKIASGESSVTKTITVKGKNLTQALTVAITGTGYSVNKQSISAADANVGTTLAITCTNTDTNAEGTLSIGSSEVSCDCNLVANKPEYEVLAGVKLTGTQWLQTNYYPNAKTEFAMKVKFTSKGNSFDSNHAYFLTCASNTSADGEKFQLYHTGLNNIVICNKTSGYYNGSSSDVQQVLASAADFVLDNSIISYTKGTTQGTIAFIPGGDNSKKLTHATSLKEHDMQNPVRIGRGNTYLYEQYELTIKELTFTEDGVTVQHWVPRSLNGVAGLLDTENGTFITSEVEGQPLVAVPLSNN